MDRSEKFNKWFNAFILIGMAVVTLFVTGLKLRDADSGQALLIIAAVGSLCGVLANVFSANGRILTFLFGLIDVTIYGVMCLTSARYGNAAMHLLYFLPMQFIGFFQWRKRGAGDGERVRARRLHGRGWLLYGAVFLVGLVAAYVVLSILDKAEAASAVRWLVILDAFSMMCNILGQWLMSTAYMEQWIFWIGVNIASVAMWVLTLRQSPDSSYAAIYVVKYAFYLLNSLNGLRIWLALSRPDPAQKGTV
jgi:nicotinamide mononucleotide transporter